MAHTNFIGARDSEAGLNELLRQARRLLAAYDAIAVEVDGFLDDGDDLRPVDGALVQERNQARGLPVRFYRFNREAAERTRDELVRLLEVAHQNRVAATRR